MDDGSSGLLREKEIIERIQITFCRRAYTDIDKMKRLLGVLLVLACVVCYCEGLSCRQCSEVNCPPLAACQWGIGKDACGCCDLCLQGPGQSCGGPWGIEGTCGTGLTCHTKEASNSGEFPSFATGKCRPSKG
ncbi:Growth factor receptor cysteine-rich domain [Trinorchestia longiramus]|nr:Growth factor receptor cysteine-rich domain [Trinorchestia longiramus]